MSKFVRSLSMLLTFCVAFSLAGCAPQAEQSAESTPAVLNCAWDGEPTSMDILKYSGVVDLKLIWNLQEPLVRIENGQVVAAGAEKWDVSEDGLTYTFTLRDSKWSDGVKVTSTDYLNLLKRQATPENMFAYASDFYGIKNFEAVNLGEIPVEQLGVSTPDENTLVIELEYPNNTFLSSIEIYPEREDIVSQYAEDYGYSPETMVYSGPFKMTKWEHNSSIVLEKNETYWDSENVNLDQVNLQIITDGATKLTSFQAGTIDYVSCSDENYIKMFRESDEMYEEHAQSARTYMFLFNCKDSLIQNEKIRQALALSINRDEICSVLDNGLTTPAYGLIPPSTAVGKYDYRTEVTEPLLELSQNTADPRALFDDGLKELGITENRDSITITLSCPNDSTSQENAEYYKAMWEENLGINIDINMQEFATYRSLIWSDEYQIATTAWGGSIEPYFLLSRWMPDNQSQWDNNEYAEIVENGSKEIDDQKRLNLYASAEKILISDNAAIAPIKYDGYSVFYYNYVQGNDNNPFSNVGFKSMYIKK